MKKKRILVLTDHMPWGHRSIAKAIFGYLKTKEKENNWQVDYTEVKSEMGLLNDVYTLVYRFIPSTNRLSSKAMESKTFRKLFQETSSRNLNGLKRAINAYKPDLVISAYFFHSISLAKWREKEGKTFKLWTVVADPWSINPVSFIKEADLHLVYDEVGVRMGKEFGVSREKILATGWWTRGEMYQSIDREKARKKFGFTDDRPVIFVGGGSLGTNSLPKLLPALMFVKKPLGLIFNSGTDRLAFNTVEEYARLYKRLRKDNMVQIKNCGWIDNMAEALGASDIVFGKAGPNFLFDVVACKRPFVSITHIGGQEDGNIDIIHKKKLGWVREKNGHLTKFFLEYLKNSSGYNAKFKDAIAKEAERNKRSLPIIEEKIKETLI